MRRDNKEFVQPKRKPMQNKLKIKTGKENSITCDQNCSERALHMFRLKPTFPCKNRAANIFSPQYQRPFTVTFPSPQKRMQMIAGLRNAAQFEHTPFLLQINDVAVAHIPIVGVE